MPTSLAHRIVRLHPAVLTVAILAIVVVSIALSLGDPGPLARAFALSAFLGVMCGWYWAVFAVSTSGSTDSGSLRQIAFALPAVLGLIAGVLDLPTNNSPIAFAIFAAVFMLLWLTASALENAADPGGKAPFGRKLLTAFILYFAFVAVWLLDGKIRRVAGRAG